MNEETQSLLCKKIAQLTRVIFHLNTKNDEYESNLRAVVAAYEDELEGLIATYNSTVSRLKESINQNNKSSEFKTQLKDFQSRIEIDKQKSFSEFSSYKRKVEDQETKNKSEIEKYKSELELMTMKYENFESKLRKYVDESEHSKGMASQEMAEYVREQNEKYNELLKKKLDSDEMLLVFQKKVKDLESSLKDRDSRISSLKEELSKTKEESLQEAARLKNEANSSLQALVKSLSNSRH